MALSQPDRIQYCGIPQCKICRNRQLDQNIFFHSNLSKKTFEVDFHQNCKTNLIIYMISCKNANCCLKYIGRTDKPMNRRLSLHRANIIAGKEGPAMLEHFTKVHNPSDMVIKAIEVCSKNTIKEREQFWMKEINTAFPYGLNDRINAPQIKDAFKYSKMNTTANHTIYETFHKSPSRRTKRGGKSRNDNRIRNVEDVFIVDDFMNQFSTMLLVQDTFCFNFIRNKIMQLNLKNTKALFLHMSICINEHNNLYTKYNSNQYTANLTYLVRDISLYKLKAIYRKHTTPKPKNFLTLNFHGKIIDKINLQKYIYNKDVINLFPHVSDINIKTPSVSYKYSRTIRSIVTNYKQAIKNGQAPPVCDCEQYDNNFKSHGHIYTGNLSIIDNLQLRNLLSKGLNYREPPNTNKNTAIKNIKLSLDSYIDKVSSKEKIPIESFLPWKLEICKLVQNKLNDIFCPQSKAVLSIPDNFNDLVGLQEKWVFVPTDKASNNISIICKKFYMETLDQEIYSSGNFLKENTNVDTILDNHANFLQKFKLPTDKKAPFLFWTPKLHKDPYGQRFITSGRGCSLQPLSIKVGYCLKSIIKILHSNARYQYKTSGFNKCYIIDNRYPITSFIRTCNQSNKVSSVSTFDFKTLYTSIPHNKLKDKIALVLKQVFKSRKKKFISVNNKLAFLSDDRKTGFSLDVNQLIQCVNYIIDQSYIVHKNELFRQVVGIPMGTNCAPHIANLFLYAYESSFVDSLVENNQVDVASKLSHIFRYQDDCIVFNDEGLFEEHQKDIYPEELELEKTSRGNSCTMLDLSIRVVNGKFTYSSYDKRNDFNFEIVNYPSLQSNVPLKPSYGVFNSQLIRFCDVNSNIAEFKVDLDTLVHKFLLKGFKLEALKARYKIFYCNNFRRWSKFGNDIKHLF